ncbi:hypothetical protein [Kitasatospora sp. A2-31]|uniref:hypothetical protein n=1 Tax=Kitasatospora sp. A2-31 TaxID=2916414 RepID=UPI001EECDFB9|nr:hypothetical protein [Kitasatospora sp. A2-31]MCG6496148.1 hypothetical protein [Kitasatospora sp. A2-31]
MPQHTDHRRTGDGVPYGEHGDRYIGGRRRPSLDTGSITVPGPATERALATVAAGGAADVDAAVGRPPGLRAGTARRCSCRTIPAVRRRSGPPELDGPVPSTSGGDRRQTRSTPG